MKKSPNERDKEKYYQIEGYGMVTLLNSVWDDLPGQKLIEVERLYPGQALRVTFSGSHNVGATKVTRVS